MSDVFGSQDALTDWATRSGLRTVVVLVAGLLASLEVRRLIAVLVRSQMLGPATALVGDRERLERREHTVETFFTRTTSSASPWVMSVRTWLIGARVRIASATVRRGTGVAMRRGWRPEVVAVNRTGARRAIRS